MYHQQKSGFILLGEAMSKVSVIIPARKELYIRETLKDLYANASGEIEVLLVLDGDRPAYRIPRRKGLRVLSNKTIKGRRYCTNKAAAVATGKFLMKMDAHCTIGEGWDEILKADCEDNWIVIPRRKALNALTWELIDHQINGRKYEYVDAMSYLYPFLRPYSPRITSRPDEVRQEKDKDELLVEDMGFQGSLWFMTADHYRNRLGGMNEYGYGSFSEEPEEIGLKTQLGPWEGKVIRNKKTWYAHWSKPGIHWRTSPEVAGRVTDEEREAGYLYCFNYWWHNRWEERAHDFEWLVDKFWPLPTWPENWRWETTQFTRYKIEIPIMD
jgi:glycosyltransferase involved in cell wall biosynthesis